MAAAACPAFRPLWTSSPMRCRNSGGYGPRLFGIVDAPFHPNHGVFHEPPGSTSAVQISGGCVWVGGVPLAPLLVCAPQRRFGNEKGHGGLDVASGQDTKSHHRTTIGSQDAAEPDALRSARESLKPEFEKRNCKIIGLSVDSVPDHDRWSKDIGEGGSRGPAVITSSTEGRAIRHAGRTSQAAAIGPCRKSR